MSQEEPGWEKLPGSVNVFTRPLLGMELWFDQSMRLKDGMGQVAIGVQFTTTIHEHDLEERVKDAVVRLRFECPLVAATIERGIHHPEFGSWVYAPLADAEAACKWADKTVYYIPTPIDSDSFLQSIIEKYKIPYILADGSEQYFRVYLTRPDSTLNTYFLSLHASHSVIDGRPGLNALSLLLEWITTPDLGSVNELAWGTEQKNLPPGPITATGGPREDWNKKGAELVERFLAAATDQTHAHGMNCETSRPFNLAKTHRVLVKFTVEESARITRALKTLGFTFSELIDAACVLAAFEQNPVPADNVDTAYMNTDLIVSLTDRLLPPVDPRKHLVSSLALVRDRIHYTPLAALPPGKERLLAAMRQAKGLYDWWLANPCFPHLLAEIAPRIAPRAVDADSERSNGSSTPYLGMGTYYPTVTNVGRVENYVAPVWPRDSSESATDGGQERGGTREAVIRVDEMNLALRWWTPTVHAWSMQGRLSVLLQAADAWDKDVLQDFMSGIIKQICFIITE